MAFWSSFKELIWPEGGGVGLAFAGHYLSRGIDNKKGWTKPFRRSQDYVAAAIAGASVAGYDRTTGDTKEFFRGMFTGDLTLVLEGAGEAVIGPPEKLVGRKAAPIQGRRPASPLPSAERRRAPAAETVAQVEI